MHTVKLGVGSTGAVNPPNGDNNVPFPNQLIFTLPAGGSFSFSVNQVQMQTLTVKKLMNDLATPNADQNFLAYVQLNPVEYEISFDGVRYLGEKTLAAVHSEINLNEVKCIGFQKNEIGIAKDNLKQATKLDWEVAKDGTLKLSLDKVSSPEEFDQIKKVLFNTSYLKNYLKFKFEETCYGIQTPNGEFEHRAKTEICYEITDYVFIKRLAVYADIQHIAQVMPKVRNFSNPFSFEAMPNDILYKFGEILAPKESADEVQKEINKGLYKKIIIDKQKSLTGQLERFVEELIACSEQSDEELLYQAVLQERVNNFNSALKLYSTVIQGNHKSTKQKALVFLGQLFLEGRGVEQSYSEASRYFKLAADLGYGLAILKCSDMSRAGQFVEPATCVLQ